MHRRLASDVLVKVKSSGECGRCGGPAGLQIHLRLAELGVVGRA